MDAIDRQAAIDALNDGAELLRRVLDDADMVGAERAKYEWGLGLIESYVSDIEELPSVQPERWISCSERLPKAQTEVIVSCTDDSGDTKFRYTSSGWVTTDKEYWIVDNEINNFVVAWKEMPEPYKGEKE